MSEQIPTYQEVVDMQKKIKKYYSELGKKSVTKRTAVHDKKYYSELGTKSAEVKKAEKLKKELQNGKKVKIPKNPPRNNNILTRFLTGKPI